MHLSVRTLITSFAVVVLVTAAEPSPAPLPSPVPLPSDALTPDPLPAQVRAAAVQLSKDGKLDAITVLPAQPRQRFQIRLVDRATDRPVLATFAATGELLSVAQIPSREAPAELQPGVPTPLLTPIDPALPGRLDGRDAAPATRRGVDPEDHS